MSATDNLNAIKNGIYSRYAILPWENEDDFQELHHELVGTYNPVGNAQKAIVFEIAKDEWRKRRVEISEMLDFYKVPITPELIQAARGGIVTLGAYIENNRAGRASGTETSQTRGLTGEVVELGYDLTRLARILKAETMLDNRIRKHRADLEALKYYEKTYGKTSDQDLPSSESPPTHADQAMSEPWYSLNRFRS